MDVANVTLILTVNVKVKVTQNTVKVRINIKS